MKFCFQSFAKKINFLVFSEFLILCFLLFPLHKLSAEEIPETYIGVRPMGMGNAFTSMADDYNSPWTNPAGVARVRKARTRSAVNLAHAPNIIFGYNKEGKKLAEIFQSSGASSDEKAEAIKTALQEVSGDTSNPMWGRASTSFNMFFDLPKGSPWGLGVYTNTKGIITPDDDLENESVLIDTVGDVGSFLNFSWTNRTNRLSLGLQIRPTLRYGYFDKIATSLLTDSGELQSRMTAESNTGLGIGADFGLLWTFADYWFPSVGLVARNLPTGCVKDYLNSFAEVRQTVCGTKFAGTINNPESPSLVDPTDFRIGFSITPRLSNKIAMRFALDIHHLYFSPDNKTYYGLSGIEASKLAHAGVEFFIGNPLLRSPLSIRFGISQGFISSGITVRWGVLVLEAATYGRDIATGSTGKEDRRTLLSISAEWM